MKKNFALFLAFGILAIQIQAQSTYLIGHHSETPGYLDATRNRNVLTEVYYPANTAGDDVPVANGQFPVIVFGHGFVIQWDAYNFIWQYFVTRGYICAFLKTESSTSPSHSNFGADMAFLASYFPTTLNNSDPILQGHIKNKTAIMGHSMGGGSTYLACQNNNIPTTLISLAAATTNPSSISAAANINIPTLTIAGSEDCVAPVMSSGNPANALAMYNALPTSSCKYYVELTGASHCQFTYGSGGGGSADLCYSGEGFSCLIGWGPYITLQQQHDRMFLLIEPWLRYYLQNDCSGWTDYLAHLSSLNSSSAITQELHSCSVTIPTAPTIAAPSAICEGDTATLIASNASNYLWSNGNTNASINVNTAGTYTVSTTNGICVATSTPVNLLVNPLPPTPVISIVNSSNLTTNVAGVNYLWTCNGQTVGTTQSISTAINGNYILTVTNLDNNCSASDTLFNWICAIINPILVADIQVFPNPTMDELNVNVQFTNTSDLKIEIMDLQGKSYDSRSLKGKEHYSCLFSLAKYAQGIYLLKITTEKGSSVQRIMKE